MWLFELVFDVLFGSLIEWLVKRLPKPVQIGCWSVLAGGVLLLFIWAFMA